MTRVEFNEGWNTLRGAGLRGAQMADPDVYFNALWDLEPKLWAATVARAVRLLDNGFFPSVGEMTQIINAAAREVQDAERNARLERDRQGRDPKTGEPYVQHHPALSRRSGEGAITYLSRLAVKLGYEVKPDGFPSMPGVRKTDEREVRLPYKDPEDAAWEAAS